MRLKVPKHRPAGRGSYLRSVHCSLRSFTSRNNTNRNSLSQDHPHACLPLVLLPENMGTAWYLVYLLSWLIFLPPKEHPVPTLIGRVVLSVWGSWWVLCSCGIFIILCLLRETVCGGLGGLVFIPPNSSISINHQDDSRLTQSPPSSPPPSSPRQPPTS